MRSPYKVRFSHGIIPTVERLDAAAKQVDAANRTHSLPYQFAVTGDTSRFDFLFPQLQIERGLLPESYETRDAPVGSTLVAEVLIGLVRGSKDSILRENNWQPCLGTTPGEFQLSDLLKLAGVINRPPGPTH